MGELITTTSSRGVFAAQIDKFEDGGSGFSTPIEFTDCDVTLQLSGASQSSQTQLYRSTIYPGDNFNDGNWSPVDAVITGSVANGTPTAAVYRESDHAWWCVLVLGNTGGELISSISGRQDV